ncbi:MAG: hypothetical protein QM739_14475 [Propionivibrio sp.]
MGTTEGPDRLSTAEVEEEFRGFSGAEWKRALSLARMAVAGLPDWTPETLLGEALQKLLSGERTWKRGVAPLVTLKQSCGASPVMNGKGKRTARLTHIAQ